MGNDPRIELRELMAAHGAAVGSYLARRLHPLSRGDLDDLVAETFIVVWRRIDDVPDGDSARPWVLGVARNILHNAHRRAGRRSKYERRIRIAAPAASAEDEAVADLAATAAMAGLDESDQELLRLHYWDDLDSVAIATLQDITVDAARMRVSRARARFVAQLDPDDSRSFGRRPDTVEHGRSGSASGS